MTVKFPEDSALALLDLSVWPLLFVRMSSRADATKFDDSVRNSMAYLRNLPVIAWVGFGVAKDIPVV